MSKPWIFMGVDRSHFSAKLRPALRYKQLHHVEYPPDMEQISNRTGAGFTGQRDLPLNNPPLGHTRLSLVFVRPDVGQHL